MWAFYNLDQDQKQRYEEMEWSTILGGAFHNPAMAKKMVEDRELRETGEIEEEKTTEDVTAMGSKSHEADPEISQKIKERAGDPLMGLHDFIEEKDGN